MTKVIKKRLMCLLIVIISYYLYNTTYFKNNVSTVFIFGILYILKSKMCPNVVAYIFLSSVL